MAQRGFVVDAATNVVDLHTALDITHHSKKGGKESVFANAARRVTASLENSSANAGLVLLQCPAKAL